MAWDGWEESGRAQSVSAVKSLKRGGKDYICSECGRTMRTQDYNPTTTRCGMLCDPQIGGCGHFEPFEDLLVEAGLVV